MASKKMPVFLDLAQKTVFQPGLELPFRLCLCPHHLTSATPQWLCVPHSPKCPSVSQTHPEAYTQMNILEYSFLLSPLGPSKPT